MPIRALTCLALGAMCLSCKPPPTQEPPRVELRQPWVELSPSEITFDDGTRIVTGGRYRFVGRRIVFRFDYRKVGDPARFGGDVRASVLVEGAEVEGTAASWSLGADGPNEVEFFLRPHSEGASVIKFEYVQRTGTPGRRPAESRTRLCFVTGAEATRVARPDECVQ